MLLTDEWHGSNRNLMIRPAPWGVELKPPYHPRSDPVLTVALVHAYTWIPGTAYPGAPEEGRVGPDSFLDYDIVITGDNHIPFEYTTKSGTTVWNCGSFMRRNSDQIDHKPRVGLIHADGTVTPHYLDVSKDVIAENVKEPDPVPEGLDEFLQDLKNLQTSTLDFPEALRQAMRGLDPSVQKILSEALENGHNPRP
jgi:hypothetical protein